MENFFYKVNDTSYPVIITYKRIKNIHYRFMDNAFYVSCNRLTSKKAVISGLDKFATSLVKRGSKEQGWTDKYVYIFGVKVPLKESGVITFSNGEVLEYKNQDDLKKKLRKFFLAYMNERTAYYSKKMEVPLYKVSVREMKSRFGSNSKHTKSIHYSMTLLHYSTPTIDSVIVHELAHILVYDHSPKFYNVVYKYCPNYDECRKKLIRGNFQ